MRWRSPIIVLAVVAAAGCAADTGGGGGGASGSGGGGAGGGVIVVVDDAPGRECVSCSCTINVDLSGNAPAPQSCPLYDLRAGAETCQEAGFCDAPSAGPRMDSPPPPEPTGTQWTCSCSDSDSMATGHVCTAGTDAADAAAQLEAKYPLLKCTCTPRGKCHVPS